MSEKSRYTSPNVNGISEGQRASLKEKLSDAREVRSFSGPWVTSTKWDGGFKTHAEVRGHRIEFDEPADLAAEDTAPTPHEYVLSAVGSCVATGVVLHATIAGITLTHLEVETSGSFDNILKWAGLSHTGNPGYQSIRLSATIAGDASDDELHALWHRAVDGSPVAQTLQRPTPVVTVLEVLHP